tara:strand:- start:666 stop:947 length:282 start_codon:yes stop_codon:yes gene_type:complete
MLICETIFSNSIFAPVNKVYQMLLKRTSIHGVMYDLRGDNDDNTINSKFTFNDITSPYTASDYNLSNLNNIEILGYSVYPTKYIQILVQIIQK